MNAVCYILPCNTTKDELYKTAKDTIDAVLPCIRNDLIKRPTTELDVKNNIRNCMMQKDLSKHQEHCKILKRVKADAQRALHSMQDNW